ncbi:MAG: hypothetical protein NT116_00735 [Candidatus Parcubacteria bacterium]|nr:hypothetical protein [Candidatus Parcubacteria bacterium]
MSFLKKGANIEKKPEEKPEEQKLPVKVIEKPKIEQPKVVVEQPKAIVQPIQPIAQPQLNQHAKKIEAKQTKEAKQQPLKLKPKQEEEVEETEQKANLSKELSRLKQDLNALSKMFQMHIDSSMNQPITISTNAIPDEVLGNIKIAVGQWVVIRKNRVKDKKNSTEYKVWDSLNNWVNPK